MSEIVQTISVPLTPIREMPARDLTNVDLHPITKAQHEALEMIRQSFKVEDEYVHASQFMHDKKVWKGIRQDKLIKVSLEDDKAIKKLIKRYPVFGPQYVTWLRATRNIALTNKMFLSREPSKDGSILGNVDYNDVLAGRFALMVWNGLFTLQPPFLVGLRTYSDRPFHPDYTKNIEFNQAIELKLWRHVQMLDAWYNGKDLVQARLEID